MSKEQHKREVGFKWMPDGSIRAYIISRSDAAAAGELGKILPPHLISTTLIAAHTPHVLLTEQREMKKIIPINTMGGEIPKCICAHYAQAGWTDFGTARGIAPHPAIMEIDMNEDAKVIQVGKLNTPGKWDNPQAGRVYDPNGISATIPTSGGGAHEPRILNAEPQSCALRGRNPENPTDRTAGIPTEQRLEVSDNPNIANCLTSVQKDSMVMTPQYRIRKLTERECFHLMDVDDAAIDKIQAAQIVTTLKDGTTREKPIPHTQQYKLAGNSIVVSCMYHIFEQLFINPEPPKPRERTLFDGID